MKKSGEPGNDKLKGFVYFAENYSLSAAGFTLLFLSISFARNFLEGLLEAPRSMMSSSFIPTTFSQLAVLFNLEWFALFAALAAVIAAASGEKILKTAKILLFFYAWIIIVPVIDVFINFPGGCRIEYLYTMKAYLRALSFFFVPGADVAVCPGIRIEVFAGFILCGSYIYIKTRSLIRSAAGSFCLYFLAVSSMAFPVFVLLPFFPFDPVNFDRLVSIFFFGPAQVNEFISRISIMIFLFSMPLIFVLYAMHSGKKWLPRLFSRFFALSSLICAAAFISGFTGSRLSSGSSVITGLFDPFLLLAGCLLSLFIAATDKIAADADGRQLMVPFCVFAAIACAALSYKFLLVFLFVLCLRLFFESAPYSLSSFNVIKPLRKAVMVFLIYISGVFISSPAVFSGSKTTAAILAAAIIYFNGLFFKEKHAMVYNTVNFTAIVILLTAGFIR
jgi:hypothetical protein